MIFYPDGEAADDPSAPVRRVEVRRLDGSDGYFDPSQAEIWIDGVGSGVSHALYLTPSGSWVEWTPDWPDDWFGPGFAPRFRQVTATEAAFWFVDHRPTDVEPPEAIRGRLAQLDIDAPAAPPSFEAASSAAAAEPAPTDALAALIGHIEGLPRAGDKGRFLRWLADEKGMSASLDDVVAEFRDQRRTPSNREAARKWVDRFEAFLEGLAMPDGRDCPFRLGLVNGRVRLSPAFVSEDVHASCPKMSASCPAVSA